MACVHEKIQKPWNHGARSPTQVTWPSHGHITTALKQSNHQHIVRIELVPVLQWYWFLLYIRFYICKYICLLPVYVNICASVCSRDAWTKSKGARNATKINSISGSGSSACLSSEYGIYNQTFRSPERQNHKHTHTYHNNLETTIGTCFFVFYRFTQTDGFDLETRPRKHIW